MEPRQIDLTAGEADRWMNEFGLSSPRPVVVLIGGAGGLDPEPNEASEDPRRTWRIAISDLLEQCLGPAIRHRGAVVLTGGTDAGIMKLAGAALRHDDAYLVGITPKAMVTGTGSQAQLEPNHHLALLTQGDWWGSESETLYRVATAVTGGTAPGVVILANGGDVSVREVRRFLQGGWPILAVDETGGTAQQLIDAWNRQRKLEATLRHPQLPQRKSKQVDFSPLADSDVEVLKPSDLDGARRQLDWRLESNQVLKAAWVRFSAFDEASDRAKAQANTVRRTLAGGAFLLMALTVALVQFALLGWDRAEAATSVGNQATDWQRYGLTLGRSLLLALPVALAVAAALGTRLASDRVWLASRRAAESLKAAIYRYRAALLMGDLREPDKRLTAVLRAVDGQALGAGVPLAAMNRRLVRGRPANVDPDELAALDARRYLKHRLDGQLAYFSRAHRRQTRADLRLVVAAAFTAALASILAGTDFAVWISFLVLVSMFLYVQRLRAQTRERLATFDRAASELEAMRLDWAAGLALDETPARERLNNLVAGVEGALERQGRSWGDNLQSAVRQEELYGSTPLTNA